MAFERGLKRTGKKAFFQKDTKQGGRNQAIQKGNSVSYVLMKIEECIRLAESAAISKIVVNKLYEATKYMAELEQLERQGRYKGKPAAKDYIASFTQRKDRILMAGIERALAAGETKEKIMENKKFFSDEVVAFLEEHSFNQ